MQMYRLKSKDERPILPGSTSSQKLNMEQEHCQGLKQFLDELTLSLETAKAIERDPKQDS